MAAAGFAGSPRFWGATAAYVVLLFAVQPFLGFGIDAFKERWGEPALDVTAGVIVTAGAAAAAVLVARIWRRARARQRVAMAVGGLLYGLGVTVARYPQERLHYLEYGVLAALLYVGLAARARAEGPPWRPAAAGPAGVARAGPGGRSGPATLPRRATVWAFAIGVGLGTLDELLQIPWARRYFDWADVLLNVLAVGLGLLVAVPAWNAWSGDQPERRASA